MTLTATATLTPESATPLVRVTWRNATGSHEEVCCEKCARHIAWAQPKPLNWLTTPAVWDADPVAFGTCERCDYTEQSCRNFERRNGR